MSARSEDTATLARGRGGAVPSSADPVEQFRSTLQQNALEQLRTSRERLTQELGIYQDPNSPAWNRLRQLAARDVERVARQTDAGVDFVRFVEKNITSGSRFPWPPSVRFPPEDVLDVDISARRADLLAQLAANDLWQERLAEHRDEFDRRLRAIDATDALRQQVRQEVPALAVLDASGDLETFATVATADGDRRLPPFGPLHDRFWEAIRGIDRLQERITENPNRALRLDAVTERTLAQFAAQTTDPREHQAVLEWVAAQGYQDLAIKLGATLSGLGLVGAGIYFRDNKAISTGVGAAATALGGTTAFYELPLLEDIDGAAQAGLGGANLTSISADRARFDLWMGRFGLAAEGLGGVFELWQLGPEAIGALSRLDPQQLARVPEAVGLHQTGRADEALGLLGWGRDRGEEILDQLANALPTQQPALAGAGHAPLESRNLQPGREIPRPGTGGSPGELPVESVRFQVSIAAERSAAIGKVLEWLEEGAPGRAVAALLNSSAEELSDSAGDVLDALVEQAGNSTLKRKQLLDRLDALAAHTETLGENPSALARLLNLDNDIFARVAKSSKEIERAIGRAEVVDGIAGRRLPRRGTPAWDQFTSELAPAYKIDKNNVISRARVGDGYPALQVKDGEIAEIVGKSHDRLSNPGQMQTNYLRANRQLKSIPAGHQLHHLIPDAVVRDHELAKIAREAGYDLDRAGNLIDLPSTEEALQKARGQLLHSGPHENWSKYVKNLLTEERDELLLQENVGSIDQLDPSQRAEFAEAAKKTLERLEKQLRSLIGDFEKLETEQLIEKNKNGIWRLAEEEQGNAQTLVASREDPEGQSLLARELMTQTISLMERRNKHSLSNPHSGVTISANAESRSVAAEGPEGKIFELWTGGDYIIVDEQAATQILEDLQYDNQLAIETQALESQELELG